jgi:DNA-binding NarL/FixJ family response regulator
MDELTPRELEVLTLVAQGKRNKEIAQELCITEKVVETHLYHIYQKLHVSTRLQAVLVALSLGILELDMMLQELL